MSTIDQSSTYKNWNNVRSSCRYQAPKNPNFRNIENRFQEPILETVYPIPRNRLLLLILFSLLRFLKQLSNPGIGVQFQEPILRLKNLVFGPDSRSHVSDSSEPIRDFYIRVPDMG